MPSRPAKVSYTDPEMIRLVTSLHDRGRTRDQIAEELAISKSTVRKILVPDFAEKERKRLAEVDAARADARKHDPTYQAYRATVDHSDEHRARAKAASRRRRKGETQPDSALAALAFERSRQETVTAEDKRRAEAARTRGTVTLSLDASIAANVLMRRRGCSWGDLIEALLLQAYREE